MYLWKLVNGLKVVHNARKGPTLYMEAYVQQRSRLQTLKNNSISIEGIKIFNNLPKALRAYQGPPTKYKDHLDKFLYEIPDQPRGLNRMNPEAEDINCRTSNNIRDWTRKLNLQDWTSEILAQDYKEQEGAGKEK